MAEAGLDVVANLQMQKSSELEERARKVSVQWAVGDIIGRKHIAHETKGKKSRESLGFIYSNFIAGKEQAEHGIEASLLDRVKAVLAPSEGGASAGEPKTESTGEKDTADTPAEPENDNPSKKRVKKPPNDEPPASKRVRVKGADAGASIKQ